MCVCVCRGTGSRNRVEERGQGTGSRVEGRGRGTGSRDGECVSELESEYERVRARELI